MLQSHEAIDPTTRRILRRRFAIILVADFVAAPVLPNLIMFGPEWAAWAGYVLGMLAGPLCFVALTRIDRRIGQRMRRIWWRSLGVACDEELEDKAPATPRRPAASRAPSEGARPVSAD